MNGDGTKSFVFALFLVAFGLVIITVAIDDSYWQRTLVQRGHAFYHPLTGDFTWNNCGSTNLFQLPKNAK